MTRKLKTTRWDPVKYLKSERDVAEYLTACIEEAPEDMALLTAALGDVARARDMMELARKTGISRAGLYKALSSEGNPSFATVTKVARALGYRLTFQPL